MQLPMLCIIVKNAINALCNVCVCVCVCVVCRSVDAESAFSLVEVARRRKGVVADVSIPEDELVTEYKVHSHTGIAKLLSEPVIMLCSDCPISKLINSSQNYLSNGACA